MSFKDQGNQAFKDKDFAKAIEFYTQASQENPSDHTILGNRSAAYLNLGQFENAAKDADTCISLKPDWSKGFQRKGMALHSMGKLEEAIEVFEKGVELDPANAQCKQAMEKAQMDMARAQMGGMGGMPGMPGPGMMQGMPGLPRGYSPPGTPGAARSSKGKSKSKERSRKKNKSARASRRKQRKK